MIEKAMASGIRARATTVPARRSASLYDRSGHYAKGMGVGSTPKNALEAHYGRVIRGNFARVSP
jgi:hypothetical protein